MVSCPLALPRCTALLVLAPPPLVHKGIQLCIVGGIIAAALLIACGGPALLFLPLTAAHSGQLAIPRHVARERRENAEKTQTERRHVPRLRFVKVPVRNANANKTQMFVPGALLFVGCRTSLLLRVVLGGVPVKCKEDTLGWLVAMVEHFRGMGERRE